MNKQELRSLIREEIKKTLKESSVDAFRKQYMQVDPNATYRVDIITSDFSPEEVTKLSKDPLTVAKALKKGALGNLGPDDFDAEFIKAHKLDNDTYIVSTGEETATVVGKPSSKMYGSFWSMLQSGDMDGAEKMWNRMDKASITAQEV